MQMRTILNFMRQYSLPGKLSLRMRLIGLLGLLMVAVTFAPPGKARIPHTPPPPTSGLGGEMAAKYLKHQGLYNSLREAVEAARYGASYQFAIDPNFTEVKRLAASDGVSGDDFGFSVAIYGDTAIVGAPFDDSGSAYVFQRNQDGTDQWGQVKKLTASDGAFLDQFGISVAIYGDTVIVGASNDKIGSNFFQGSAYAFERNQGGANNWGEVKKLTASDGAQGDGFRRAVAIYAGTVIIGAFRDDIGSIVDQGSAYVFERNQGGANNWGEVRKLFAPDGVESNWFGFSVAIYGNTAVVGTAFDFFKEVTTQGSAYVSEQTLRGTDEWAPLEKPPPSDEAGFEALRLPAAVYAHILS